MDVPVYLQMSNLCNILLFLFKPLIAYFYQYVPKGENVTVDRCESRWSCTVVLN